MCCFVDLQKHIGEGSRIARELFVMERETAQTIMLMDKIDSIGSSRTDGGGGGDGGDSEAQRTMLELLNQLCGFEPAQLISSVSKKLETVHLKVSRNI